MKIETKTLRRALRGLRDLNPGRALRSRKSRKIPEPASVGGGAISAPILSAENEIQVAQKPLQKVPCALRARPGSPPKGDTQEVAHWKALTAIQGLNNPGRALLPTLQWGWPLLRHGLSLPCVSPNSRSRKSSPCSPQIASSGRSSNCTPRWPEPGQSGAPNSTPHHHSHRILKLFQRRLCDDL